MSSEQLNGDVSIGLRKILNNHGFGFQYAVLRRSEELFRIRKSIWIFEAAEYPVSVKNYDTRIDFILKSMNCERYIVAECKRANPAFSNWCFVKTPYIRSNRGSDDVIVENLRFQEDLSVSASGEHLTWPQNNLYQLGVEVRSGKPGDSDFKSRGAIEEAATQVCRGMNGLVEEFHKQGKSILAKGSNGACFIPVIFTTAKIWTSEVDMGIADLQSGEFALDDIKAEEKNWVWLEYHTSPGIKHAVKSYKEHTDGLGEILVQDYIRTIAIVSANGIDEFLRRRMVRRPPWLLIRWRSRTDNRGFALRARGAGSGLIKIAGAPSPHRLVNRCNGKLGGVANPHTLAETGPRFTAHPSVDFGGI